MQSPRRIAVTTLTLVFALLGSGAAHAQGSTPAQGSSGQTPVTLAPHTFTPSVPVNLAKIPYVVVGTTYTFTVTTAADSGSCPDPSGDLSLRCAISAVNVMPAASQKVIAFNIPSTDPGCSAQMIQAQAVTVCTIKPTASLPTMTASNSTINGYTQPGAVANTNALALGDNAILTLQLDGSLGPVTSPTGLTLSGAQDIVEGLSVTNFGYTNQTNSLVGTGLWVQGTGDRVCGNFIGVTPEGTAGFDGYGIYASGDSVTVGGTAASARNVISGNGMYSPEPALTVGAVGIYGSQGLVQGNLIGTDPSGTTALPNILGVWVSGPGTTIGGTAPGAGNVISGNQHEGVALAAAGVLIQGNDVGTNAAGTAALGNGSTANAPDSGIIVFPDALSDTISRNVISASAFEGIELRGATGTIIQANKIGTNAAGTARLGNAVDGIAATVPGTTNTVIGGTTSATRNIISGNGLNGVELSGGSNNVIQGNYIGVNPSRGALGNALNGVFLHDGETGDTVGGSVTGAGNVIANNVGNGVLIGASGTDSSTVGDAVRLNSIYNNPLGISLNSEGPGICSTTVGIGTTPNDYFTCPTITAASVTAVSGTGHPLSTIDVYVASSVSWDGGYGEGKRYLGTATTDSGGNWTLPLTTGQVTVGQHVTATITNSDLHGIPETSEFCANVAIR